MDIEQMARDYADRAFADYLSDPRTGPALIEQAFMAGYANARETENTAARHDREEIGKLHSQIDRLKAERNSPAPDAFELMAKCLEISDQVAGEGVMADKRHAVLADVLLALRNRIESIERVHAKDILNREKEYPNIMGMLDGINRAVVELTFAEPDAIEEKQDESGLKELWDAMQVGVDVASGPDVTVTRILHNGNVWEFSPDHPPRFYPAPTVDTKGNWRT